MNKQIKAGADIHAGDGGYSESTQEQYDAFVKVRNKSLAQGRIKELAEQAGFDDRGSNHTDYMNFDHEIPNMLHKQQGAIEDLKNFYEDRIEAGRRREEIMMKTIESLLRKAQEK